MKTALALAALFALSTHPIYCAELRKLNDIEFAKIGARSLKLDLYLPPAKQTGPLILWVHGGAWRSGSKNEMPLAKCVAKGYAAASVDYRLSTEAKFPAQAHDIKAAIRFLRAKAGDYNISAENIVIAGGSAGGHLAALIGVSNGEPDLEGTEGDHLDQNSSVQGIVSFYGASDLTTILDQSTPHGLSVRVPALDLLLGGQPKDLPDLAQLASPVFHVDKNDPPLLLFHGDRDPQMPINQAHQLMGAYQKAGAKAQFEVVYGAGHGGHEFYDEKCLDVLLKFLRENFPEKAKG